MVDTARLKGIIAEQNLSQRKVAKSIGITEKTFYDKMKKQVFTSTEIEAMIDILKISNPIDVFFAQNVAYQATSEDD